MKLTNNWKLFYVQDSQYKGGLKDVKHYQHFDDVKIPTMFELEIYRNGLLGHPYESTNNWDYVKYEDYHQFYVCSFNSNRKNKVLKLNGIDTISEVFVNGKLVGKTDNMFLSYSFKLSDLKETNELVIHILPAVVEGRKFKLDNIVWAFKYNYEGLYLRKSNSSFGWDILPRTPLGGIYKDVELLDKEKLIQDFHIKATKISKKEATLSFDFNTIDIDKYTIEGKCGNSKFYLENYKKVVIKNPKLWNIRGFGKPYLYTIKLTVFKNNKVLETKIVKFGIRKVELFRSSIVQPGGKFEFHINDEKVFLLGTNWVPIDAIMHVDDEMMLKTLNAVVDLGCNAIRIWGGGTYETDLFYEKCDELGIFIWQDFMMGCTISPQDEYFQNKLREEATYVVKHLRNHASLCLWAGDNENDLAAAFWQKGRIKPNENVLTRKVLPEVIDKYDGTRPYLPSSPYIDEVAEQNLTAPLSEDHLWGPRDYFKGEFYGNAKCYFTSETGYHAINNLTSLKKYIRKPWPLFTNEKLEKVPNSRLLSENNKPTKEYLCHSVSVVDDYESPFAYRTLLMANQVMTLFTNEINTIEEFIMGSQISSSEGFKYFIERMRKDYDRNGGIIWWNIKDGWPQMSEAPLDYYFSKKLSYDYIKRSQQRNLIMMNEDPDGLNLYVVSSDKQKHILNYRIINAYTDEVVDEGVLKTKPRSSYIAKKLNVADKQLLVIKYKDEKGNEYVNHFHTKIIDIDLYKYVDAMSKYGLLEKGWYNR